MENHTPLTNRYMLIDGVRGIAIVLMVIYHFSWDLSYFQIADFDILGNPYWIWFARFIAGLILLVVGVAYVMAQRSSFDSRKFLKRLVVITACAAAVSFATYQIDPKTFVYFGILHHIAVATILLLIANRLPRLVLALMAGFFLIGPQFLKLESVSPTWLMWSGLAETSRISVDYLPLFPWFGIPLLGMVLGREMLAWSQKTRILEWKSTNPLVGATCFVGRHSLLIYMAHQPILFGGLYAIVSLIK